MLFYSWSITDIQYCISFLCSTVTWNFYTLQTDHCHKLLPSVTIQSEYNIIGYISHTVHNIPITYFITRSLYLLFLFTHFAPCSQPPSLWQSLLCSLYLWIWVWFGLVCICFFRFHLQVKPCSICLSLPNLFHIAVYSESPSGLLQVAKLHYFLWVQIPPYTHAHVPTHTHPSLSIQLPIDTICFQTFTTVNNAAVETGVYVSFQISVFIFWSFEKPLHCFP